MSENFREQKTEEQNYSQEFLKKTEASQAALLNQQITAATRGDVEAFGYLYELYFDQIFRYCLYRVMVQSEAEDLTAEVFLKAWQAIGRYRLTGAPFLAWLYKIAHNLVQDRRKERFRQNEAADAGLDERFLESIRDETLIADPLKAILLKSQHRALYDAIKHLSDDQQQILYLRFVENWSHAEIAQALDKKEGTVRGLQFRGLASLGKLLGKENFVGE